jgi:hypothetical protein
MVKENTKWTRRNLAALWDGQPFTTTTERTANMAECDRIMIALHRFQTEGKKEYRRQIGIHGGGGGTKCKNLRKILTEKVKLDLKANDRPFPEAYWPSPVPNATPPSLIKADNQNRCFAYTFCWHAQPEFLLWHRALTAELERGLQEYDPKYGSDEKHRHNGPDALACPYWAWEGWDGLSLPQFVANHIYILKTDRWAPDYPQGSIFPNPFHRWFAPVSIDDQINEIFPPTMSDNNTTTRASAFTDCGTEFCEPWEQVSSPNKPSMREVVHTSIQNPDWLKFCTMNPDVGGGNFSIENAHNKFHNHVGGRTKGGIQGSGVQTIQLRNAQGETSTEDFTGTMGINQSIFDPMWWLHHSNVERQLISWQKRFANEGAQAILAEESLPSEKLMSTVLYPFTKPEVLFADCGQKNHFSWETPSCPKKDATFKDWWPHNKLPYTYDEYLEPAPKISFYGGVIPPTGVPDASTDVKPIRMKVHIALSSYKGGEYILHYTPISNGITQLVGSLSVLSGAGSVCSNCTNKNDGVVAYEVSNTFKTQDDARAAFNQLSLTRNDDLVAITSIEVLDW